MNSISSHTEGIIKGKMIRLTWSKPWQMRQQETMNIRRRFVILASLPLMFYALQMKVPKSNLKPLPQQYTISIHKISPKKMYTVCVCQIAATLIK